MWKTTSLIAFGMVACSLLTAPAELRAGNLLSSGLANTSGDFGTSTTLVFFNNTSKVVKFKVRRGDGSYVGQTGRVRPGEMNWFFIGNPPSFKVKAYIWNKRQRKWVGKTNWIEFQNTGSYQGIELYRTGNGSNYGLTSW